jgi:hypothetical protein
MTELAGRGEIQYWVVAISPVFWMSRSSPAMTAGRLARRAALGLVGLVACGLAGCRVVPTSLMAPSPNRPKSTLATTTGGPLLAASAALDSPSELSAIEPVPAPNSTEPTSGLGKPPSLMPGADPVVPVNYAASRVDPDVQRARLGEDPQSPGTSPLPELPATSSLTPIPLATPPVEVPTPPVALVFSPPPASPPAPKSRPAEPVHEAEPEKPAEPPRPDEIWRDGIRKLASLAKARLEQGGGGVGATSAPWGLRARVLAWLAEPDIDPGVGVHEVDDVRAVLKGLGDPAAGNPPRGEEIRAAVQVLEERAPLEIAELKVCRRVDGFGDFVPYEPAVRKPGEGVVIYCEVEGLRAEAHASGFRTRLAAQLEIVPEGGGPPAVVKALGTGEESCRRRRRDYYIAYGFTVPKTLAPGHYRLRLTQRDLVADRTATREVEFTVATD